MAILVIAEHEQGVLKIGARQAVTAAQQLDSDIHLLVAGDSLAPVLNEARQLTGVDKVLALESPELAYVGAENFAPSIAGLGADYSTILAAHTSFARDLLPRAAALMGHAMVSEVIEIEDANTFLRPIYAGNLVARVRSHEAVKILTVRGSRYTPAVLDAARSNPVEAVTYASQPTRTTWLGANKSVSDHPELGSARVVVSGGRSLGSQEKFEATLTPLASALGAAIGASRAAVDAGYAPNETQVGQTGTQVAPDLYIALGISGSVQHTAGMKDSKVIVAVNLDPEAPIFRVADYGLVADLFDVAPQLTASLSNPS
jgi:electron transfer flavoprotein alpha subunit